MIAEFPKTSDRARRTAHAFWEPKVGMLFHEMYSYWLYVVDVNGDIVTTLESGAPCTFPDGDSVKVWRGTVEEFSERWAYKGIIGFSMDIHSEDHDVAGWAKHAEKLLKDAA